MFKRLWLPLLVLSSSISCSATLSLSSVFSDHMILQREQPVPVWGKADPGATITVEFSGQIKTVTAGTDGKWRVDLDPLVASSESRELKVSSNLKSEIINQKFSDVLVGEVWLCSGQSNMQFVLRSTENGSTAVAEANYPRIRLFTAPLAPATEPKETIDAKWDVCTPATINNFSGVAYYFGKKLHQDLNVPIGLLLSAWGGTRIEPWTPPCGFEGIESLADTYKIALKMPPLSGDQKQDIKIPTALYNGMIHAYIPFAIRGAIWYQGEANYRDGMRYVDKTKALLNGWRKLWGYEFPFYFVQIAPYQYGSDESGVLPTFWEAQAKIVKVIPKTGMAVISDYTTITNIHPRNKEVPGTRLALLAEANTYGMNVVSTGPVFQRLENQGNKLKVIFGSAEGLTTRDGKTPDWFEVAGKDGLFRKAEAEISGNAVIVQSSEVSEPATVRFAWHKLAMPNLMNGAGLPAPAFRTEYVFQFAGNRAAGFLVIEIPRVAFAQFLTWKSYPHVRLCVVIVSLSKEPTDLVPRLHPARQNQKDPPDAHPEFRNSAVSS